MKTQLFVLFFLLHVVFCKNYYDILEVPKTATLPQIKKAFRNLALKYHPDKNPGKDAEAQFREIVEAYEVLSDPEKKKTYDQSGYSNFKQNQGGSGGGGGDFNFNDFFKNFDEAFANHQRQHHSAHQRAHQEAMRNHQKMFHSFNFDFDNLFDDSLFGDFLGGGHGTGDSMMNGGSFFEEFSQNVNQQGQNCRTVTKKMGNTVMQHTECH